MPIEADTEVSLFVRDRATGRLVFNPEAIKALGLSPAELSERGFPLDDAIASPPTAPADQPPNVSAEEAERRTFSVDHAG